jgi:hypothetical protein
MHSVALVESRGVVSSAAAAGDEGRGVLSGSAMIVNDICNF